MNPKNDLTVSSGLPVTEPLKAGDTVTVNREEHKVLSVDETGNPELIVVGSDKPELVDFEGMKQRMNFKLPSEAAVTMWNNLVSNLLRKAKGLKPEEAIELPNGGEGKYIAYAFDNQGRLSVGKQRGRRRQRIKSHQATFNRLVSQLFGVYLSSLFRKAQAVAKAASTPEVPVEPVPMTQDDVNRAQKWAIAKAGQITNAPKKQAAKAARARQKVSRRINSGVLAGNSDRCAHAGA